MVKYFCDDCGCGITAEQAFRSRDFVHKDLCMICAQKYLAPSKPYVYEKRYDTGNDIPDCCKYCSNHPRNGGNGFCVCSLPNQHRTVSGGGYTVTTTYIPE